jgi:hypothetical protein
MFGKNSVYTNVTIRVFVQILNQNFIMCLTSKFFFDLSEPS